MNNYYKFDVNDMCTALGNFLIDTDQADPSVFKGAQGKLTMVYDDETDELQGCILEVHKQESEIIT